MSRNSKRRICAAFFMILACVMLASCGKKASDSKKDKGSEKKKKNVIECSFNEEEGILTINGTGKVGIDQHEDIPDYKIKKIIVGEGITELISGAFSDLGALESVELPSTLKKTEERIFQNDLSLQSIKLPEGLTEMGGSVFAGSGLKSVEIPSSLTTIPDDTFRNCRFLTDVKISEGVTTVGNDAFRGCISLKKIDLPSSVNSILANAFGRSGLTTFTFTKSMTLVGDAFLGCDDLEEIIFEEGTRKKYLESFPKVTSLVIPGSWGTLDREAMDSFQSLESLVIEEGVTTIEPETFMDNEVLKYVELPQSLTEIGERAFYGCLNLRDMVIPSNIQSIGEEAFYDCNGITDVVLPDTLTYLGDSVFMESGIHSLYIPSSIGTVPNNCCRECESLDSVVIEDGITSIGWEAFYSCHSLRSITLPGTIDEIDLEECTGLHEVHLKEGAQIYDLRVPDEATVIFD